MPNNETFSLKSMIFRRKIHLGYFMYAVVQQKKKVAKLMTTCGLLVCFQFGQTKKISASLALPVLNALIHLHV